VDKLDIGIICDKLSGLFSSLTLLDSVPSTNDYFLNKLKYKCFTSKRELCIAREQSAGRGRGSNTWYSPKNKNLYLSLYYKVDKSSDIELSTITSVVLQSIFSSIKVHLKDDALLTIKLPNDILIADKKVSGVLTEVIHSGSHYHLVVGVGLNIYMYEGDKVKLAKKAQVLSSYFKPEIDIYNFIKDMVKDVDITIFS